MERERERECYMYIYIYIYIYARWFLQSVLVSFAFHTLSFTHNFRTHHLSHTPFFFVTHHLSHTTLSQTPFFFVTHHLSHTTLSHTTLHIELVLLLDPPSHPLSFLPSPFPPLTFADHYWKKLTCGVFRFLSLFTESIIILYMYKSI